MEGTRSAEPMTLWLYQGAYSLTETRVASTGLRGSALGPLSTCCSCQLVVFVGLLTVGAGVSLALWLDLGMCFLLLGYLVQTP